MKLLETQCPHCKSVVRLPIVKTPNFISKPNEILNLYEVDKVENLENYFYEKIMKREKLYLRTIIKFPNIKSKQDGEIIEILVWNEENKYYWVNGKYSNIYTIQELLDILIGNQKFKSVNMFSSFVDVIGGY